MHNQLNKRLLQQQLKTFGESEHISLLKNLTVRPPQTSETPPVIRAAIKRTSQECGKGRIRCACSIQYVEPRTQAWREIFF